MGEARGVGVHRRPRVAESLEESGEGVELLHAEDVVGRAGDGREVVDQMTGVRRFARTGTTQQDNRLRGNVCVYMRV